MSDISNKMTKNDVAWERLFDQFDIVNEVDKHRYFEISSTQINKIGQREARLMTKFDHQSHLPQLFRKYKLSILPNSRGTYLIGRFKTHYKIKYSETIKPIKKSFPREIESILPDKITSEAVALNIAYASGMIDEVIGTEDYEHSYLTLSGRLGSKQLQFSIDPIDKREQQFEIVVKTAKLKLMHRTRMEKTSE